MPDSIGHHRRFKAGREVKVSTAYLGGLAVSDKHGTVVTSANTTRTTGRTARSPMRSYGSYEVYMERRTETQLRFLKGNMLKTLEVEKTWEQNDKI